MHFRRHLVVAATACTLLAGFVPVSETAAYTKKVPILMYHRVAPTIDKGSAYPNLVVTPSVFESQMKALKAGGWKSLTARQVYERLARKQGIPSKTVVITFDDGRDDGYDYAWPIMQKYGFVGTFYVVTGRINRDKYLSQAELVTLATAGNEIANHTYSHISMSAKTYAVGRAELKKANDTIQKITGIRPIGLAYPYGHVDSDALRAAKAEGIEFATTTVNKVVTVGMSLLEVPRVRVNRGDTAKRLLYAMSR